MDITIYFFDSYKIIILFLKIYKNIMNKLAAVLSIDDKTAGTDIVSVVAAIDFR